MRLKRYVSEATPSGKTYQPRLPEGALSKYWEGIEKLGQGISALARPIQQAAKERAELDRANTTQKITSDMSVGLAEAFNDEALNHDHETLIDRYRERAEKLRDQYMEGIGDPYVKTAVMSNYGQIVIRHMARMYDLKNQYWKDNTLANLNTTISQATKASIAEADPALMSQHIRSVSTQIEVNRRYGLLDDTQAQKLQKSFLHDVEYGKMMGLIDTNPLEAYRALKRGDYPNLDPKQLPNYILNAKNKYYEEINRYNAETERMYKWSERAKKEAQESTFSNFLVKAREGKLDDAEIKYAAGKGWLEGDKLKAIYKFKDEFDVKLVGDKVLYGDFKVSIAAGYTESEKPIIDAYLNDRLNSAQASELLEDFHKVKYASDAYKWGAKEIDQLFFKGPFDFGSDTVRRMRRMAISEYRERVIDRGEDAVAVATELANRYDDWRKKRKSGELLPPSIQTPAQVEQLYKTGAIGKYTYNAWKILLQQTDIAAQVSREEATNKTGGPQ